MMRNVCSCTGHCRGGRSSGRTSMWPAEARTAAGRITKGLSIAKKANDVRELQMTDAEEQELGKQVSEKIRTRYGVVQDAGVHRYVSLVGLALAQGSTRPTLPWTFIVLDTDGVNAFAAPGGYVHITRGLLALIKNEAELAGVLGHEIIHVTEKHTIRAIQKSQAVQMGAAETLSGSSALMQRAVTATYDNIVDRGFGRAEENEADEKGVAIANKTGYAPNGLVDVPDDVEGSQQGFEGEARPVRVASGNAGAPRSHHQADRGAEADGHGDGAAALREEHHLQAGRSRRSRPSMPARRGLDRRRRQGRREEAEEKKAEEPKKGGFGLSKMLPTSGGEKKQAQVTASGGARGVDPEKDSKGGPNPAIVAVKIAAADVAAFKKEGGLS